MYSTIQDLVTSAYIGLGLRSIAISQLPTPNESNYALELLNEFISTLSGRRLLKTALTQEQFTINSSSSTYTIGPGAVFNTSVPISINSAFLRDSNNEDWDLKIIYKPEYDSIDDKSYIQSFPWALCYDPGETEQTTRTGNIIIYPKPDQNYTLFIESMKYFSRVAITDAYDFPEGYQEFLKYNLMLRLCVPFGLDPSPAIIKFANEAETVVLRNNQAREKSAYNLPITSRKTIGNIYTYSDNN